MADWVSGKVTKVEYWTDALFSLYVRAPVHPFTACLLYTSQPDAYHGLRRRGQQQLGAG